MTEIITPKKEEVKTPEIVIPVVTDATYGYKKDSKMFYVIIPVEKMDAFTAACLFDSLKLSYLQIAKSLMAEIQSKIYKPGMMTGMKNFIRGTGK